MCRVKGSSHTTVCSNRLFRIQLRQQRCSSPWFQTMLLSLQIVLRGCCAPPPWLMTVIKSLQITQKSCLPPSASTLHPLGLPPPPSFAPPTLFEYLLYSVLVCLGQRQKETLSHAVPTLFLPLAQSTPPTFLSAVSPLQLTWACTCSTALGTGRFSPNAV